MRPGGGQPNMQQLMKQAQKMQQQMVAAQQELAEAQVNGTSGGGLVTATTTGAGEVLSVKIDPKAVDPDDVESLEDLVVAAITDAGRGAGARGGRAGRAEVGPADPGNGRPRAARHVAAVCLHV